MNPCDTVEFNYRKEPDASSQNCTRWGVVYPYEPGETPDPGAGGGTTPPPTP